MTQRIFRTSDGYTFYRVLKDTSFVWVDSLDPDRVDMTFDDVDGEPVDIFGETLEGKEMKSYEAEFNILAWAAILEIALHIKSTEEAIIKRFRFPYRRPEKNHGA